MRRLPALRLQHRIFLYFSLVIILSTILFGYYAYRANVRTAEDNFTSAIMASMSQTANGLAALLREGENQANLFAGSYVVQEAMAPDSGRAVEQYDRYISMQRVIDAYEKSYSSFGVRVYLEERRRFMNDRVRYFTADDVPSPTDSSYWFRRNSAMYWALDPAATGKDDATFTVYRSIFGVADIGAPRGAVSFGVKREAIRQALEATQLPNGLRLYAFDERGLGIDAIGGRPPDPQPFASEATMDRIRERGSGRLGIETEGEPALLVFQAVSGYPLYLGVDVPLSAISNQTKFILNQFLVVALLVLSLSFVLAYFVSRGVTRQLKRLMSVMGRVETHDFNIQVPVERNDEIGILTGKFNWMIERIRALIEDVYKSNYEKKESELKLLQAQINPHFLYNTLDSVHWLAVRHAVPDISYMVRNLSDFLRLSLHVDGQSTLGMELKHIAAYFNIQRYRFEDRIELADEVPTALYDIEVIPLILQPLVENAILHGILPEEDRKGVIRLRARAEDGVVVVEVEDDGIGPTEERLTEVAEMLEREPGEGEGTGLRNVHRRLRFRYDAPYGLRLRAGADGGAICEVQFPDHRAGRGAGAG